MYTQGETTRPRTRLVAQHELRRHSRYLPALPVDILYIIFGLLSWRDRLALSSVSRQVRVALLPLMFTRLELTSKLTQTLIPYILQNSDTALLDSVRKGAIRFDYPVSQSNDTSLRLLSSLQNLETLELIQLPDYGLEDVLQSFRSCTRLKSVTLSIEGRAVPSHAGGLQNLKTLRVIWTELVSDRSFYFNGLILNLVRPSMATLEHLHISISAPNRPEYLQISLHSLEFPMLHTLYLDWSKGGAGTVLQLSTMAPNLEDLTLNLNVWESPGHSGDIFATYFAMLKRLKRLSLIMDIGAEISEMRRHSKTQLQLPPDPLKWYVVDPLWRRRFEQMHLKRTIHLVGVCRSLEHVAWLHFHRLIGGTQLLTQFVACDPASDSPGVKVQWDQWDLQCYKKAFPGKPVPDYISITSSG